MGLRRSKEEELEDTEPSDTEEYKEFKEKWVLSIVMNVKSFAELPITENIYYLYYFS